MCRLMFGTLSSWLNESTHDACHLASIIAALGRQKHPWHKPTCAACFSVLMCVQPQTNGSLNLQCWYKRFVSRISMHGSSNLCDSETHRGPWSNTFRQGIVWGSVWGISINSREKKAVPNKNMLVLKSWPPMVITTWSLLEITPFHDLPDYANHLY